MSKVKLEISHHLASGCCMWNGIEDVYCTMTGYKVPDGFFFMMASFAEPAYIKMPSEEIARMFSIGDGRPTHTYENLKEILGLNYKIHNCKRFDLALNQVKKEVLSGNPVILGPLDMYHLPYLKMYHKYHIPIHYIMMVGFDDAKECIFIYDCDRTELIELPYLELQKAWSVEKSVVGDKNGYISFQLAKEQKSPEEILLASMKRKAVKVLAEKPYMIGVSAFTKIAKEFPSWKKELSDSSYRATLMHLPEYWGMVPKLPNRFLGMPKSSKDIPYQANMDRFAHCLNCIGQETNNQTCCMAASLFSKSGLLFQEITNKIIDYICDNIDSLDAIPDLFLQIGSLYQKAYESFLV